MLRGDTAVFAYNVQDYYAYTAIATGVSACAVSRAPAASGGDRIVLALQAGGLYELTWVPTPYGVQFVWGAISTAGSYASLKEVDLGGGQSGIAAYSGTSLDVYARGAAGHTLWTQLNAPDPIVDVTAADALYTAAGREIVVLTAADLHFYSQGGTSPAATTPTDGPEGLLAAVPSSRSTLDLVLWTTVDAAGDPVFHAFNELGSDPALDLEGLEPTAIHVVDYFADTEDRGDVLIVFQDEVWVREHVDGETAVQTGAELRFHPAAGGTWKILLTAVAGPFTADRVSAVGDTDQDGDEDLIALTRDGLQFDYRPGERLSAEALRPKIKWLSLDDVVTPAEPETEQGATHTWTEFYYELQPYPLDLTASGPVVPAGANAIEVQLWVHRDPANQPMPAQPHVVVRQSFSTYVPGETLSFHFSVGEPALPGTWFQQRIRAVHLDGEGDVTQVFPGRSQINSWGPLEDELPAGWTNTVDPNGGNGTSTTTRRGGSGPTPPGSSQSGGGGG